MYSAKLLMDRFFLLVLMLPVLTGYPATESSNGTLKVSDSTFPNSTPPTTTCAPAVTAKPNTVVLFKVGRIKVQWEKAKPCQGKIYFKPLEEREAFLCYKKDITHNLGPELCAERRCAKYIGFKNNEGRGYKIHTDQTVISDTQCNTTLVMCEDIQSKELVAYKIITGLLLTLIIAVLFCRFMQPTYIAVRKRFSQKRQNRWIGPTQTQSVSYHRGQANNPNNNTVKRQSYPGLERLTVNPSREPSSNRNSDYDSYGS